MDVFDMSWGLGEGGPKGPVAHIPMLNRITV